MSTPKVDTVEPAPEAATSDAATVVNESGLFAFAEDPSEGGDFAELDPTEGEE